MVLNTVERRRLGGPTSLQTGATRASGRENPTPPSVLAGLVARAPEPVAILDQDGTAIYANAALRYLVSGDPEGGSFLDLVPSDAHEHVRDALARAARFEDAHVSVTHARPDGVPVRAEYRLFRLEGGQVAALGHVPGAEGSVPAAAIAEQSEPVVDPKTGFLTAAHLGPKIAETLSASDPRNAPVSLILIELVGLERTVRNEGERVGSALRRAVAQRLRTLVRSTDVVGWLDDARFLVVAPNCNRDGALIVATRLGRDMVKTRFAVAGRTRHVPLRTGVAEYGDHASPQDLIADACADLEG